MHVPVVYDGPKATLDLSWTTYGLHFEQGAATDVPYTLVQMLLHLPGHGFTVVAGSPTAPVPVVAPPKAKPGRKPKEI